MKKKSKPTIIIILSILLILSVLVNLFLFYNVNKVINQITSIGKKAEVIEIKYNNKGFDKLLEEDYDYLTEVYEEVQNLKNIRFTIPKIKIE